MKTRSTKVLALTLLLLSVTASAWAQPTSVAVDRFLHLGPFATPYPAFKGDAFKAADLLSQPHVDISDWWPSDGDRVLVFGQPSAFNARDASVVIATAPSSVPQTVWSAFYVRTDRFDELTIEVQSSALFEVFVNGTSLTKKTTADTTAKDASRSLPRGKHLVVVKQLRDAGSDAAWTLRASVSAAKHTPSVTLSPDRDMTLALLLDEPVVSGVSLSHDGSLAAVTTSSPEGNWIDILRTTDTKPVHSYKGPMSPGSVQWSPTSRRFITVERKQGTATVWMVDLENGTTTAIATGLKNLGSVRWSRDGSRFLATVTEQPDSRTDGFKRLDHPDDRLPGNRTRSHLLELSLDGSQRRLTWGDESVSLLDEHPAGDRLLVSRTRDDFSERPYTVTEIGVLTFADGRYDSLMTSRNVSSMTYSPDGRQLLVFGNANAFDGVGNPLPDSVLVNNYDTELFVYTLADGSVRPITKGFDPSVSGAQWSPDGQSIFLTASDKAFVNLFRYDVRRATFTQIPTGVDITGSLSMSRNGTTLAYVGNGVNLPHKAYVMDVARTRFRVLHDANPQVYADVRFGGIQPWTFTTSTGVTVDGHVYYPPDFDPSKTYPVIVNYYAGTTPVSRDFGGRYPKEIWAANGYIVYVPQPSGAIGYGQAFSAAHVNNWGITVADELIESTKGFLAAHPFVDAKRVGAIGASYGGFMTMLLLTRTDIYAAAISHAGISNITSYWGEGYWGYSYSSIATAESFPWNRRDIYVDQSPIFFADKVTTPLLLLHGASDTNVPLGESWQFYTALKLLGKDVDLIEVADQDHHILNPAKRKIWSATILAYFDKVLKDQPEWWEEMY